MAKFRKRGNTWSYRIYYTDIKGEKREKSKGGFKTKALASSAAIIAEAELNKNSNLDYITLYDFTKEWAEIYKKPHITDKTWETYTKNLKHIKTYFGDIRLKKVNHTLYQKKINEFANNYAQETLEKFHYQIKAAASVAVRDGIIKTNFADGAIVKSLKQPRNKDTDFLEESEYINLIKITSQKYQFVSYFALYLIAVTGMRFAEATGITWDDIDLANGIIDINKSYDYSKTQQFMPTKNEQSKRQVPIDQKTIELLKNFREYYYKENNLNRVLNGVSNSLCNRLIKQIVGRSVRNHSLRHTYASYLISKGIDLISISQLLGHENLNITLKVYAHQLDNLKIKNNQKIKTLFNDLTDF
ncbi:TPA: site-specific integrase [Streptococcus agalactiae]|nr:site-specific integrase [Streptococcus agalactiae]